MPRSAQETCKKPGYACEDCNNTMFCSGVGTGTGPFACSMVNATTPYCSKGECVEFDTCNIDLNTKEVKCPKYAGVFLDPMDCTSYYSCDGSNETPDKYECPGKSR